MESGLPEPMNQNNPQKTDAFRPASSSLAGIRYPLTHLVAIILCLPALAATLWFVATNPAMIDIFGHLFKRWQPGRGSLETGTLLLSICCFAGFGIIGWFYLETHEIYVPVTVAFCLAFLFGLSLCGFVFEGLAIAGILMRTSIAMGLGLLLIFLAVIAHWRFRQVPETGTGGTFDSRDTLLRRQLARQSFRDSLVHPAGLLQRSYVTVVILLIGLISFFLFWHAVLYPAVYWDSLILYLGYARMTFLEGVFPVKVTGQVGIGLGANYPHLFEVLGAGMCTIKGSWSEIPQRLMVPLTGLASTCLVYHIILRLTRHVTWSLSMTLLYRSIPLGLVFDQYASNYSLAILFTTGFLYLALMYIETGMRGYFRSVTLLLALSMHLNYLMGILWLPWLLMVWLAHWKRDRGVPYGSQASSRMERLEFLKLPTVRTTEQTGCPWAVHTGLNPLRKFLVSDTFWRTLMFAVLIGSTWLIRNWVVTGNPVYAFFHERLGGIRINPDVMKAAAEEWAKNGAGIGNWGESLQERLMGLWPFLTGAYFNRAGDLQHWMNSFRLAPVFTGFALPGLIVLVAIILTRPWNGSSGRPPCHTAAANRAWQAAIEWRFGLVVLTLMLGYLFFHLKMAPYYLYQICPVIVTLVVLASFSLKFLKFAPWRWFMALIILVVGMVPGLAMAMMGFKIVGPVMSGHGRLFRPAELYVLRNPLPDRSSFLNWRYGDDQLMWDYLNRNLSGTRLLTHENRHLALDPSIQIVHLDDWDMQELWQVPDPAERVKRLVQRFRTRYYLYVPNEDSCATNALMGAQQWPELGLAELVHQEGPNRLYRLRWPPEPAG
jgi:hypothetical protein